MLVSRLVHFMQRPAVEKRVTVRFLVRKALAKLPYAPIPMPLTLTPAATIRFWWSYVPMAHHTDRTLWEYWGDDRGELRFVWQFLERGMGFFDIGAHHGFYSLVAASKIAAQQVTAFEPSSRERRRFKFHMLLNGIHGVQLEPYAVSSASGTRKFFTVASGFTTMNGLRPPEITDPIHEAVVEAVSLDEYLKERQIRKIDLLKIDIEGGELEAFRGASQTLVTIRPLIICEVLDSVTRPWGYPAREIVSYLRQRDYCWFDFWDEGTISPHIDRDEYPEVRNYLAVPREKLPLVDRWQRT